VYDHTSVIGSHDVITAQTPEGWSSCWSPQCLVLISCMKGSMLSSFFYMVFSFFRGWVPSGGGWGISSGDIPFPCAVCFAPWILGCTSVCLWVWCMWALGCFEMSSIPLICLPTGRLYFSYIYLCGDLPHKVGRSRMSWTFLLLRPLSITHFPPLHAYWDKDRGPFKWPSQTLNCFCAREPVYRYTDPYSHW